MPSQPSSSISCAWNTASAIVVAATPATTGTRPLAALTTTSTMRRRWAQRRYANSPVDPKAANPCTPAAIRSLHRRFRTSSTTSPEGKTGETRCGKTPWNAASGINKHNHRIKAHIQLFGLQTYCKEQKSLLLRVTGCREDGLPATDGLPSASDTHCSAANWRRVPFAVSCSATRTSDFSILWSAGRAFDPRHLEAKRLD